MPISTFKAIAGVVIALMIAAPAHAERWKELLFKSGWTYRIDLDALKWDGRTVQYRVEIVTVRDGAPHRSITTALINCETNERKFLGAEHFRPDGSSSKDTHVDRWRPIESWWGAEASRQFLCTDTGRSQI